MADGWDVVFKVMADGHRRAIMAVLCEGPRPASDLARLSGLAKNAVSFHLRWLKSAGLVTVEHRGRWRWYRVEAGTVAAWLAGVQAVFGRAGGLAAAGPAGEQVGKGPRPRVAGATGARRVPRPHGGRRRPAVVRASRASGEDVATDTLPDELL
jgi:DNA-binding transcriptional ArsR family regulator